MTRQRTVITALTALLIPAIAYAATTAASTPAAPATADTNAEKAAWEALMSPEGEYAALAAYTAVVQKYGPVEPYATILRSEQMHAQGLTRQLQRYGVTVPANPYLGKVPAPTNLKAAAQAEVQAEVNNVAMYDRLFALAGGDAQLTRVFTNLRTASQEVHLPLFQKAAAGNGTLSAVDLTTFHNGNLNTRGQGGGSGSGMGLGRQGMGMNQGQHMNADCPMQGQNQQHQRGGRGNGSGWRR